MNPQDQAGIVVIVEVATEQDRAILRAESNALSAARTLDKAKARGMRYIHLPIGYNGFDEARKLELVRATRDSMATGPVYLHCHHGKHRSAGAAGTVAVSLAWLTTDQAVERMKVSGTAPNYKGLYACTSHAVVL